MNKALVTRFMAHLYPTVVQSFQGELQQDPNKLFDHVSQWFLKRYWASNKTDRHKNRTQMEADWNFNDIIESLINRINTGL